MSLVKILKHPSFLPAKIFLFWIILFLPHLASAQIDKTFWFAAPYVNDEGRDFDKPINLRITTLATPATVVVSMPAEPSFTPISINIGSNSTSSVDLTPWIGLLENNPANTALNKGLLIKSTADITAYYEVVSSFCNCDPEAFSLKGKNALGTEFFISSQYTYDESSAYQANNSFDIVASEDNTRITITPTKDIVGHAANTPFTIVLNKGQTYSAVAVSSTAAGHLQGSYIASDKAIAVTLKDDLVQVSSCADLMGDQTVPTSVLGNEYIVTKGYLAQDDNIYVLAVADGTSVYVDGNASAVAVLAKGESTTLNLSNPSTYIRSNKNIYVYHLTGNGCEVGSAIIPKINCTGSQSVSVVRSSGDLFAVMITTKNGNQNNFTVNGDKTLVKGSSFSAVPGTGGTYVTARIDLSAGVPVGSALDFSNSTGKFSLGYINGGSNDGTRYGFFSDFKSSNVQSSSVEICASASAQLSAFGGVIYKWSPAAGLSNPNIANPIASPAATTDYVVAITNSDGCLDSAKVHVKVYTVKNVDTTVSICSGGSYKLPSGKVVSTAGTYNDKVSYKSGCDSLVTVLHLKVSSASASVTIVASGNNICAGTPVTFTANPVNEGPSPVYQWHVNGTNAGTNSPVFNTGALVNGDKVSCTMTSSPACGTPTNVTSNIIAMIVSANQPTSVTIAASKNNICAGSQVTFTATPANGGNTPVYQWQVNGANAGANSPTFSSSTLINGDVVNCVMTSNAPCATPAAATSNTVTMVVNPYVTPSVTIVASANDICPAEPVTFTATAVNGGTAPTYQWLVNGNKTGTNSATFTSNILANGDVVNCVLTVNGACITKPTATSNSINIKVNGPVSPSVTIAASKNSICAGTLVTFTATPKNGGNAPIYQWLINGNDAGTNGDTFESSNLVNGDIISCRLTSSANCAVPVTAASNSIAMVVISNVQASVSIAASQNDICAGTMVKFTAIPVNGGGAAIYQWQVNGANAGTNSNTFSSASFTNGDIITCAITSNALCAIPSRATSNAVTMSVNPYVAPSVTIAASVNDICPGEGVTFTATPVNGGTAPAYQWLVNGNNAGANSATFASSTLSHGDVISCMMTSNSACITTPTGISNSIGIKVSAPVSPSLTIAASVNNICADIPVTFTATAVNEGSSPVYQWLINGSNAGTNSYIFTSGDLANGDVVTCRLTSNAHCAIPAAATSNGISMIINPLPVVNGGGDKTIKQDESILLNATASGNITDITWSPTDGLDNAKTLTPKASPVKTTTYTLTVQSASGCAGTATVKITVLVEITIPNTFTPNGDGVNDTWEIKNLSDYPDCSVKIFDRWGQEVYDSKGYYTAWDGTRNGKRLPFGTYYYVINLNNNTRPLGGWVALIR